VSVQAKVNRGLNVTVTLLALGHAETDTTSDGQAPQDEIDTARSRRISVVAAAGNDGGGCSGQRGMGLGSRSGPARGLTLDPSALGCGDDSASRALRGSDRRERDARRGFKPGFIGVMKVAVVGSGGLGGYFGALLARGGTEVSFIARGAHLDAMRRDGLRIEGGADPFVLEDVRVTDDPGELGPVDLVMVCVKLWDTEAALEQLRPLVGPETTLVSFQNGVLKDSLLRAAYDESQLIGGVAYVASTVLRPGVITRTGPLQRLVVGEFDGDRSRRVEAFHAACMAGGIDAEMSDDIRRASWEKFVFLVGLSATTTTMRVPVGPIRSNPQSRAFLLDLMREVVAVGRAQGVPLPEDYAERRLEFADGVSPEMTSSMHHDLERGNPLEVRWLSGGVVDLGKEVGVDTPLNRAVADILSVHANGRIDH